MYCYKKILILLLTGLLGINVVSAKNDVFETSKNTNKPTIQTTTDKEVQSKTKEMKPVDLKVETENNSVVEGSIAKTRSMTLEECIKLALLNNPSIKTAISNKEIYKTKIGQAWSAYFPTLSVGLSYSRNRMMQTTFQVPKPEYNLFNMPSLEADFLVYDFGKTRSAAKIATKTFEASEDNLQASINNTIYSVKAAYYNLLYAFQKEHVYADTVANYEAHLEQTQDYYRIGAKPKIDVITAQYNLGNAKLNYIKAKHEIEVAYAKLNNAMGLPEHVNYNIDESVELPLYELKFDDLYKKASEMRPELLAATKKADASKILIRATKSAFMPDIKMYGAYTLGGVSFADNYSFQLGGGLQYNAVNLYKLKKQVDEAKATYQRDSSELEQAKQNVYLEVKSALIVFDNAKESIPVAKLSLLNAKEQYSLASGRYKTGLSDVIELKDAEVTYLNAQLAYYNTLLQYNIALSNLEKVVGTNLAVENTPKQSN